MKTIILKINPKKIDLTKIKIAPQRESGCEDISSQRKTI